MIAVDTNFLVYTHQPALPFHEAAYRLMQELAGGSRPWGIPEPCVSEFLSVVTNLRNFKPPTSTELALAQVEAWLASPSAQLLHGGAQHISILSRIAKRGQLKGGQFHDARIAAVCIENGVREIWTVDRDYSRMPELASRNPLV